MNIRKLDIKTKVKFLILLIILGCLCFVAIKFGPWIIEKGKHPEEIRNYLRQFGNLGFLIFILIQAIHVMVVVIPGDLFNVCGGFIYGIPLGFMLSFVGLMLGTIIVFYMARFLGYDFVSKFIKEEKITHISNVLNSTKGMIGMFIICLIPFIPKDLMMYVAGLTPVKPSKLFFVYALSRIPGTLIWVSVGANTYEKDYFGMSITLISLLLLIALVFLLKNKYTKKINIE